MKVIVVEIDTCKSKIIEEKYVGSEKEADKIKKRYKGKNNILCLLLHVLLLL